MPNDEGMPNAKAQKSALGTSFGIWAWDFLRHSSFVIRRFAEGNAHVIRDAGGRATDDAIRSLVVSYELLGTRERFVTHQTDCGARSLLTGIFVYTAGGHVPGVPSPDAVLRRAVARA
jgi:hypothetical protein